jgi:Putative peptidoglycan binding domain
LQASNAPRVNANSVNFQVRAGIAVPSSVTIASVSTYPALIDVFPAYRDDSFFVVEDEVVIVDRQRRIVDVVPVGPRARFAGGSHGGSASSGGSTVAVVDLPPDDIRVIQRVLIERGVLHGEADGIWGPDTREAITVYQRQQGIAVTGSIDMRTVSSLGVSGRLSQQASQSIQSQSSSSGAQTSTDTQTSTGAQTSTGQGQTGTGTAQSQTGQPSNQQNATGQTPNQNSGQAQNQPSSTTRQSSSSQPNTTGQANQPSQSESSSTANQPSANQSTSPTSSSGSGSSKNQPAPSGGPSR